MTNTFGKIAIFLVIAMFLRVSFAESEHGRSLDCAVNALFLFHHLERNPITLDSLSSALPPLHPDGYSMLELSSASESLGLSLEGVHFRKGDSALDRPAIAFFKSVPTGHYVVLQPVGNTGTMVQIIDPPHPPRIVDYVTITASSEWTGQILIRRDSLVKKYRYVLMITICWFALAIYLLRKRLRLQALSSLPSAW